MIDFVDASEDFNIASTVADATSVLHTPEKKLFVGYLTEDGTPPNGAPFDSGISFPSSPQKGMFYLRVDYFPNRLFRYDGRRWIKSEDNVRMTLNNLGTEDTTPPGNFVGKSVRLNQKGTFINNTNTSTINGQIVAEKQALSKVLKPKADN